MFNEIAKYFWGYLMDINALGIIIKQPNPSHLRAMIFFQVVIPQLNRDNGYMGIGLAYWSMVSPHSPLAEMTG